MTEQDNDNIIELDVLMTTLASVVKSGTTTFAPVIMLDDESELFDSEGYVEALTALSNHSEDDDSAASPYFNLSIISLEEISESVFRVILKADDEYEEEPPLYSLYLSRQFLQAGQIATMFLGMNAFPALIFMPQSEMNEYLTDSLLEPIQMLPLKDTVVHVTFRSTEVGLEGQNPIDFARILSTAPENYSEDEEGAVRQLPLMITSAITDSARADIIEIITGLSRGDESALHRLEDFIDSVDELENTISTATLDPDLADLNSSLTTDEKTLLVTRDFLDKLFKETDPYELGAKLAEEEDSADEYHEFEEMFSDLESQSIHDSFDRIVMEESAFRPAQQINSEASLQARLAYLSRPTNHYPLARRLASLSSLINIDLLYSRDWNGFETNILNVKPADGGMVDSLDVYEDEQLNKIFNELSEEEMEALGKMVEEKLEERFPGIDLSEDEYEEAEDDEQEITHGQVFYVQAILVAQRCLLLADICEDADEDITEDAVVVGTLVSTLTLQNENAVWMFSEGMRRASHQNQYIMDEFLKVIDFGGDVIAVANSPVGGLLYDLGKAVINEGWPESSLMIAFETLPDIQNYLRYLYSTLRENREKGRTPQGENKDMNMTVKASVVEFLESFGEIDASSLMSQTTKATSIIAELNAMKHTNHKKDSTDWSDFIDNYIRTFLS